MNNNGHSAAQAQALDAARQQPPTSPEWPTTEIMNEQARERYAQSVAEEVQALIEERGCQMTAFPQFQACPTGGFTAVAVVQITVKPSLVIKKET